MDQGLQTVAWKGHDSGKCRSNVLLVFCSLLAGTILCYWLYYVNEQDSTFEFERKRNRPERYDRNVTEDTLKAIKKIDKVRVDREARHIAKRLTSPSPSLFTFLALQCSDIVRLRVISYLHAFWNRTGWSQIRLISSGRR